MTVLQNNWKLTCANNHFYHFNPLSHWCWSGHSLFYRNTLMIGFNSCYYNPVFVIPGVLCRLMHICDSLPSNYMLLLVSFGMTCKWQHSRAKTSAVENKMRMRILKQHVRQQIHSTWQNCTYLISPQSDILIRTLYLCLWNFRNSHYFRLVLFICKGDFQMHYLFFCD